MQAYENPAEVSQMIHSTTFVPRRRMSTVEEPRVQTELMKLSQSGDVEGVRRLLQSENVNINAQDADDHTALFYAVSSNSIGMMVAFVGGNS